MQVWSITATLSFSIMLFTIFFRIQRLLKHFCYRYFNTVSKFNLLNSGVNGDSTVCGSPSST